MSTGHTADILIIGAGPAGATLARELPGHLRVVLADKRFLEAERVFPAKPCGGLLAPDAQECLFHMGLSLPAYVLSGPQLFGVRAIDLESGHERCFQRHYTNFARDAFERWLYGLARERPNVAVLPGRRYVAHTETADGVTATFDDGSSITARVLVSAEGAHSRIRRGLGGDPFALSATRDGEGEPLPRRGLSALRQWYAPQRNLAVQAWYRYPEAPSEYGAFFHGKVTRQYAWSIPKGDYLLVGATMPWPAGGGGHPHGELAREATVQERFSILADALRRRGYALETPEHRESCALLSPGLGMRHPLGAGRVLLLGEAAGLVSPSSAEGLSYAFRSAMALAGAVREALPAHARAGAERAVLAGYRARLRRLVLQLACKWAKATVVYQPWLRRRVLASGLRSTSAGGLW